MQLNSTASPNPTAPSAATLSRGIRPFPAFWFANFRPEWTDYKNYAMTVNAAAGLGAAVLARLDVGRDRVGENCGLRAKALIQRLTTIQRKELDDPGTLPPEPGR